MRFDYDRPAAWYVDTRGNDEPTVFATENEAKEKTDEFIARIRGIIRVAQCTGRSFDIGHAATLLGHSFGTDQHLGGFDVTPLSEWQAERDEETARPGASSQAGLFRGAGLGSRRTGPAARHGKDEPLQDEVGRERSSPPGLPVSGQLEGARDNIGNVLGDLGL